MDNKFALVMFEGLLITNDEAFAHVVDKVNRADHLLPDEVPVSEETKFALEAIAALAED